MSIITLAEKKRLKSLLTKKGRNLHGQFVAEGVRLLEESIHHKWLPQKVYFCRSLFAERGEKLLESFAKLNVQSQPVSSREMEHISGTTASQGILGLFDIPQTEKVKLMKPHFNSILFLYDISNPGNLGTLYRSALAFGFQLVAQTKNTVEPFNPKVVRASAGAMFGLPIAIVTDDEIFFLKKTEGFRILSADIGGKPAHEIIEGIGQNDKIILAVGSEAAGLSDKILDISDFRIRIVHEKSVESLNAAVAGSIIMKEIYEKRIRGKL